MRDGMVEAGEHLGFTLEPSQSIGITRECLGQDLESDLAVELRVGRFPHFAHPAFGQFGADGVMPERCADAKRGVGA